jgi:hydrogenase nickel incorporation protein HypA/HybF
MHELSLAGEVIKIAEYESEKNMARLVKEITIEVGNFSGVDVNAFESALGLLSEGSIIEKARLNVVRINGKGFCPVCEKEYEMNQRIDTCPGCHSFPSEVRGGYEFRVVSLLIE